VLRRFNNLAAYLGFRLDKVSPVSGQTLPDCYNKRLLLVITGPGPRLKQRCSKPLAEAYKEVKDLLFVYNLHNKRRERREGITVYYIRQSIYLVFFGIPGSSGTGAATLSLAPRVP
jgi:hypothetical protein